MNFILIIKKHIFDLYERNYHFLIYKLDIIYKIFQAIFLEEKKNAFKY